MATTKKMKIGILASGGNSPAMNNTIIGILNKCKKYNYDAWFIRNGYSGIFNNDFIHSSKIDMNEFISRGNIVIGSARCLLMMEEKNRKIAADIIKKNKFDVLCVIGGDGSYNGAFQLSEYGVKVIALPGTIDNDISSTNYSIGFDTCLQQIVLSIDALRDSFSSHNGICFVEVMGRHFSDLAIKACIACNCQYVVTEDNILNASDFAKKAKEAFKDGVKGVIFVITENIYGKNNLPSLNDIAKEVGKLTNNQMCRAVVLGHIQRGGVPTGNDRFLSTIMGQFAMECVNNKKTNISIGYNNGKLIYTDIKTAVKMPRKKNDFYLFDK